MDTTYRPIEERVADWEEVERALSLAEIEPYINLCNNCGVPFCHGIGCPLANIIPDMIARVKSGKWEEAWKLLSMESFMPEFTARLCPALCENVCTNNINEYPVRIRYIEKLIVETAFAEGFVRPFIPSAASGKKAAVVGSGPAGLVAAEKLMRAGHKVTVYEKNHKPGGLLRYGIPDFKLNKGVIERRVELMKRSGIEFICDAEVGRDISPAFIMRNFDAAVIAVGTPVARDLNIEGRKLKNIHFALEFLSAQNRVTGGEKTEFISAAGKHVAVIGGGDTGSDCVGVSVRHKAASVTQIDIMPAPPEKSPLAWPAWPYKLNISSSRHEAEDKAGGLESFTALWSKSPKLFIGENGVVKGVRLSDMEWEYTSAGRPLKPKEKPNSEMEIKADLVILAMGFTGLNKDNFTDGFGLTLSERGTAAGKAPVFTAGDTRAGQSLVVRAMADSMTAAAQAVEYLK